MRKKIFKKAIAILSACFLFGMVVGCNDNSGFGDGGSDLTSLKTEKMSTKYVNNYFNENDLYHDQAYIYMSPLEPTSQDQITLRLKCRYGSCVSAKIWYTEDSGSDCQFSSINMKFESSDVNRRYEYWVGVIPASSKTRRYHFSLSNEKETVYYNFSGISETPITYSNGDWIIMPDFFTPEWSKGTVWYSVMPDSFFNGNTLNDKTGGGNATAWGNYHTSMGEYFGGDFDGIESKVDYLKELGVDSLFLNPVWLTTHQAGYGAFDFMQTDSAFGSEEMLKSLVDNLHENDMQIMLDAVFEYINVSNILYNQSEKYPYLDGAMSSTDSWYNVVQRQENGEAIYSSWGSPLIDFSSEITRDYFYRNEDSVMQYYIREVGIDGWRMDVGNDLSGSDSSNYGTSSQILKDMRYYVKNANEDALFLSEHADGDQFDYILDSKWNYAFGYAIRDWAAGLSNQTVLMNTIENGVLGLPRSVANSSYNFLTTHDLTRLIDIADYAGGDDTSTFNAANIIMFMFVGSPCVYYGEEVGMKGLNVLENTEASSFYNSMEWDETDYNQEIYNVSKALGKLRKQYPTLFTNGAYMNLSSTANSKSDVVSFARFSAEGVAITSANPTNNIVKDYEIDIGKLDIRDGAVLVDYLTGREYKVTDGKIVVDVYPGGSIFVTGDASEDIVGGMKKSAVGTVDFSAIMQEDGLYLKGTGKISGTQDNFGFVYNNAYSNTEASVTISGSGEYAFIIRDGLEADDAFYGVKINGKKVRVFYRAEKGGAVNYLSTREFSIGDRITLIRSDDNSFSYTDGVKSYDRIKVEADYYVYAGVGAIGEAKVTGFYSSDNTPQRSTDFSNGLGTFTFVEGEYTVENGLTLSGSGKESILYAPIGMCDFTVKTLLENVPANGRAGIAIGTANDYIFVGRALYDGESRIIMAHVTGEEVAVYASIDDVNGEIVIQLEKVGSEYRAVLINAVGEQTVIGEGVYANYSAVSAMLIANDCEAKFGYLSFGDDIDGREGFAAYKKQGEIEFDLFATSGDFQYKVIGGEWQYTIGGIEQINKEAAITQYAFSAHSLSDFRATFALKTEFADKNSYVQAMWGKSSINSEQGYALRLSRDGVVKLINNSNKVLGEYVIENFVEGKAYDFTIEVNGSHAFVYFGLEEELILQSDKAGCSGYFSWTGYRAKYAVLSYGVFSMDGNYKVMSGGLNIYENEYVDGGIDLELSGGESNYGYMVLSDVALSDFVLSFNMQMKRTSLISRGRFRVYIGGTSGYNSLKNGLILQLDDKGRVSVYEDGELKVENQEISGLNAESCYLIIAYTAGELKLYKSDYREDLNYTQEAITEIFNYRDSFCRAGAIAFYTRNATVRMCNIRAFALAPNEEYSNNELFTDYFVDAPLPPEPEIVSAPATEGYVNDFSDKATLGDFTRYSGAVSIKNGVLIVDGTYGTNWDAGAGLAYGTFENFELSLRVKVENAYGWAAVEFNKASPSVNHQQSALTLLFTQTSASLYLGNDVYQAGMDVDVVTDAAGFATLTLRVENGLITYDFGGASATCSIEDLARNTNLTSGFISFNSGANRVMFDDITITLL